MPSCHGTIYGQTWRISASPREELVFKPVMREILRESLSIKGWTSSAIQAVLEVLRLEKIISDLGSFPNTLALDNYLHNNSSKLWHLYSWLMNFSYQRSGQFFDCFDFFITQNIMKGVNFRLDGMLLNFNWHEEEIWLAARVKPAFKLR